MKGILCHVTSLTTKIQPSAARGKGRVMDRPHKPVKRDGNLKNGDVIIICGSSVI